MMSQNAKLSLLAALVIGGAILLIWCAGDSAPGPGRGHRIDPVPVADAQQNLYDNPSQPASARRPPPGGYTRMRAGPPGAGDTR
ncbi:MAG: hypothetical protein ABI831_08055 [Betaproteobacteria bacterium]